ncbi:hypothetical protein [Pseudochrobactrum kiredjianiae]|uniref:hypothetical protein n=1 Tax=Pseudochrobactrum kiredjianiae TaxID=386305 RepID=UPI0035BBD8EF|nr:hypothetical protein [Pseudochrobactrum kiredjianiae]
MIEVAKVAITPALRQNRTFHLIAPYSCDLCSLGFYIGHDFQFRGDDIETLMDGFRLMIAMRMVGNLMKWMTVAVAGSMFEEGRRLFNSG